MPTNSENWDVFIVQRGQQTIRTLWPVIYGRGYIAGSFAAWACSKQPKPWRPRDVDIFASSAENARDIGHVLNDTGWSWCHDTGVGEAYAYKGRLPVQIVRPHPEWKNFPHDILRSFDFDVCVAVFTSPETVLADPRVGAFSANVLRVNDPLRTMKRAMKYFERGVCFTDSDLLKLFYAWDEISTERKAEIVEKVRRDETDDTSGGYLYDEDDDDDDEWDDGEDQ
jgi:hypothetical protein